MELLEHFSYWYADKTFIQGSTQFFTVLSYVPAYLCTCISIGKALFPKKDQVSYINFLRILIEQNVFLNPHCTITDFETTTMNAFEESFSIYIFLIFRFMLDCFTCERSRQVKGNPGILMILNFRCKSNLKRVEICLCSIRKWMW